jgi:cell division septal protein FtsQ
LALKKTRLPSRLEKRRRARRVLLVSVVALLLFVGTMPLWSTWIAGMCAWQLVAWSDRFRVRQTEVSGNHLLTRDQIIELAAVPKGVSLFAVPVNAARVRIEKHPWIRSAIVRRRLPDTIEIRVTEREPVAAVRSDRLLMITSDSVALAPISENWNWDFPLLTPPGPVRLKPGTMVTDTCTLALLREALTLRAVSKDAWHNLSELYYSDNQIHAALSHPSVDILLGHGTSELSWAGALKILNDKTNVNLARCQSIDLRIPGKIIVAEGANAAEERTHG